MFQRLVNFALKYGWRKTGKEIVVSLVEARMRELPPSDVPTYEQYVQRRTGGLNSANPALPDQAKPEARQPTGPISHYGESVSPVKYWPEIEKLASKAGQTKDEDTVKMQAIKKNAG